MCYVDVVITEAIVSVFIIIKVWKHYDPFT
jgi:hypothetical protein